MAFWLETSLLNHEGACSHRMKNKNLLYSFILLASFIILSCIVSSADVKLSKGISTSLMPGNQTYINKPVYPVRINASQIPIGGRWTFAYFLKKGSVYHIYFIGDWIGSKTDYDVYVYNPKGNLEAVHTASAGLPEHLGNTVDDPFFTPERTGRYYFLIFNDPRESHGEDAATLMVIEHLECNRWYEKYIKGKVNFANVYETAWAYEFVSDSERIEVLIDVPETLDMYEARLYLMANPSKGMGEVLNGYPLAWEPGLYGEISGDYGGYNLDDEGFRNEDATASCEFFGQDMLINYTSPSKGDRVLYHLVLIGENGEGTVRFMIKTDFEPPSINLQTSLSEVHAGEETVITAQISDQDSLRSVLLYYTNDSWASSHSIPMTETSEGIYAGTIPAYPKGSKIEYKIVAVDMAGNTAEASGSYLVKDETMITFNLSKTVIYAGEKIVVTVHMSHGEDTILLNFTSREKSVLESVQVDADGSFNYEYTPDGFGDWVVTVIYPGDETYFGAVTEKKAFKVMKFPTSVDFALSNEIIDIGGKINITGSISPAVKEKAVEIRFTMPNGSVVKKVAYTDSYGRFKLDFIPSMPGKWNVKAFFPGDNVYLSSTSRIEELTVNNTWMNMLFVFLNQFMMYIATAIGGTVSAVAFLIYWRRRE